MRKIVVFLIISVSVFLLYREYSFTEYIPLVFAKDEIIEKPSLLTERHKSKMIQVLNYYDEKWKLEDEKLLIKGNIDRNLLRNYTTKANDSDWLKTHK
jgi:hypothetical protein